MAFLAQPTLMVPNKIKKQIKQIENNLFIGDRVHPSPHQKGRHDSNSIKFLHLDSRISVYLSDVYQIMNEPYYSIICNLMRLSPIMLMGITWLAAYYLLPNYNKFRFLLILVISYIIGVFLFGSIGTLLLSLLQQKKSRRKFLKKMEHQWLRPRF